MLAGTAVFSVLLFSIAWLLTPLGIADALYLVLLSELLPVLAVIQLPLVQEEEDLFRLPVYLSSGLVILLLGGGALALASRRWGMEGMGLGPAPMGEVAVKGFGLFLAGMALVWVFLIFRTRLGIPETRLLRQLLPRSRLEKLVFVGLSLGAGVGEEAAYRGYLVPALTLLLGWSWGAALVSSIAFGVLHAYQGWMGILRTGVLGFLFAASFLAWGTLWPAVTAHVALDLVVGLALGDQLVKG